jgi:putative glutamine amidotransferase
LSREPAPPLIGVTTRLRTVPTSYGDQPLHTISRLYSDAVIEQAGIPVLLPPQGEADVGPLLDRLDGVVLAGGGDMVPALHGREDHPTLYDLDEERDRFELRVVRQARRRRLPLLAICRGMQVLNVAFGGDLVLDIPSEVGTWVGHRAGVVGEVAAHPVRLDPGSRLARLLGTVALSVNSHHHQGLRSIPAGLRAVAWAEDGVVEAVEPEDEAWPCWGVQWHPEYRQPDNAAARRPFEALVRAAARQAERAA